MGAPCPGGGSWTSMFLRGGYSSGSWQYLEDIPLGKQSRGSSSSIRWRSHTIRIPRQRPKNQTRDRGTREMNMNMNMHMHMHMHIAAGQCW